MQPSQLKADTGLNLNWNWMKEMEMPISSA